MPEAGGRLRLAGRREGIAVIRGLYPFASSETARRPIRKAVSMMGDVRPKVSKESADYRKAKPGGDHCGVCRYFERLAKRHCLKVEGIIEPDYWRWLFEVDPTKAQSPERHR
jgi:hypothetical protein